uniref:VWFA domain-containing protein n=1 Tax=Oryzias latipes TaxID=8090 RepID=A0A3P9M132_ORYLA
MIISTSRWVFLNDQIFTGFCCWETLKLQKNKCENALVGDIVFLVDSSSSIGPENFELVKTFLGNVIKPFDIGPKKIQFGLAQYSKTTQKEFLLKDHADQESVLTAVQQLYYLKKSTRTGGALDFIRKDYFVEAAGSRVGELVPQIAVLITDGESNDPVETPAQQLRDHGVLVFCVGVGKDAQKQLKTIANPPQDHYVFIVDRYEDLHSLLDSLLNSMYCHFSCLNQLMLFLLKPRFYCSMRAVDLTSDVNVCLVNYEVRKTRACVGAGVADVVFVLKGSEGTGEDNFPFVLTFLSLIINSLEISQAKVRVGIVTSGPWLRVEAHLNTFTGKAELLHFIGLLPPREGGAKIGVALKLTWEMLFSEERGGRKNAQKVAVVIADSKSQDSVREAASFLRRDGATIYAVGVKDADPTELEEMASHPSSRHVFPRANFSSLRAETHSLLKGLCNGIANKQRTAGGSSKDVERGGSVCQSAFGRFPSGEPNSNLKGNETFFCLSKLGSSRNNKNNKKDKMETFNIIN